MTVMGKDNAMGKHQTKTRNWIPARLLILGAVAVMCGVWSLPALAETIQPNNSGSVINVTGNNNTLQKNYAYTPWRGFLNVNNDAQLNANGNFYLAGNLSVNSSSTLDINKSNVINLTPTFILANGGQIYLAGDDASAGLININTNFTAEKGSALIFQFSNAVPTSELANPASNWDNVANIQLTQNAIFNGNMGIVSQGATPWQTANGTTYQAARIMVSGLMTTGAIDVAPSSLFYRTDFDIVNAGRFTGPANNSVIYVSAAVSGFGGLNDNLRGLENIGYGVNYLNENQMAVARNLDRARMTVAANSPIAQVIRPMWNYGDRPSANGSRELGDKEQIARINLLGALMDQLSGDTHANAMYLGLYRPWTAPLSYVNLGAQMVFTGNPAKPLGNMNRVWITPTYTGTDLKDDGNARSGNITRTGAQLGVDRRIAQNASAGIALGYHSAYLDQADDRVQFCDLQLGVYGGAMVGNYFEVRSYLGLGLQTYDSTRIVHLEQLNMGDASQSAFGKTDGCGVYFTTEVSRPIFCGPIVVRPTLAIDSETAIRKEFTETGDVAVRLRVGRTSFSRNRFRIGGSFETNPQPTSRVVLTSRIFYGVQLDGQDYARVDSQFDSVQADPGQTIRSIASGFNYLDVGGGIKSHINKARTLTGILNYDGSFSEYTNTNTVALGLMYIF